MNTAREEQKPTSTSEKITLTLKFRERYYNYSLNLVRYYALVLCVLPMYDLLETWQIYSHYSDKLNTYTVNIIIDGDVNATVRPDERRSRRKPR